MKMEKGERRLNLPRSCDKAHSAATMVSSYVPWQLRSTGVHGKQEATLIACSVFISNNIYYHKSFNI